MIKRKLINSLADESCSLDSSVNLKLIKKVKSKLSKRILTSDNLSNKLSKSQNKIKKIKSINKNNKLTKLIIPSFLNDFQPQKCVNSFKIYKKNCEEDSIVKEKNVNNISNNNWPAKESTADYYDNQRTSEDNDYYFKKHCKKNIYNENYNIELNLANSNLQNNCQEVIELNEIDFFLTFH